uniref:Uncharacterized protein n=1 Tax=Arundo donax TaxID=35708 RepID=A0A0A9DF45_ARUDO
MREAARQLRPCIRRRRAKRGSEEGRGRPASCISHAGHTTSSPWHKTNGGQRMAVPGRGTSGGRHVALPGHRRCAAKPKEDLPDHEIRNGRKHVFAQPCPSKGSD